MITVQPIRCPAHFLRLIAERRCGLHVRSDGLPLWLIVGCWSWDGAAAAVTVVEPLDETLFLPHLQADPETGATTLCEPHRWAGWPACIEAPA